MKKYAHLDLLEKHLDIIHPAHVRAFLTLLTELRDVFDGDLDAMIILCAISVEVNGVGWEETLLASEPLEVVKILATNTKSIAEVTGIPRETVRRKISSMQEKGWVQRDNTGNWRPTRNSARDLEPATRATMTYISALIEAFEKAKADAKN